MEEQLSKQEEDELMDEMRIADAKEAGLRKHLAQKKAIYETERDEFEARVQRYNKMSVEEAIAEFKEEVKAITKGKEQQRIGMITQVTRAIASKKEGELSFENTVEDVILKKELFIVFEKLEWEIIPQFEGLTGSRYLIRT